VARQAVRDELVDVLRLGQPSEQVRAEIARRHVGDESSGGVGEENLAAVPGPRDTRSAMDVDARIPLLVDHRRAAVESHANTDLAALRPVLRDERLLGFGRCGDRGTGVHEYREELVAVDVDLQPAVARDGLAQEPPLLGEQLRVLLSGLMHKPRGALDVGEEERNGARRERAHEGSLG